MNKNDFLRKAKKIHGDQYTYPDIGNLEKIPCGQYKVRIICKDHGEFFQRVSNHISNHSKCPQCVNRSDVQVSAYKSRKENYISKVKQYVGKRIAYDKDSSTLASEKLHLMTTEYGMVVIPALNGMSFSFLNSEVKMSSCKNELIETTINRYLPLSDEHDFIFPIKWVNNEQKRVISYYDDHIHFAKNKFSVRNYCQYFERKGYTVDLFNGVVDDTLGRDYIIAYSLGMEVPKEGSIEVKQIDRKEFFNLYHQKDKRTLIGLRDGKKYGAYVDGELVGSALFVSHKGEYRIYIQTTYTYSVSTIIRHILATVLKDFKDVKRINAFIDGRYGSLRNSYLSAGFKLVSSSSVANNYISKLEYVNG